MLLILFVLIYARAHGFKKIHFLYIDCCVLALFLFFPLVLGLQISGTLHRFPAQKSKLFMLTLLLKRSVIQKLIVHGEYTRGRLLERKSRYWQPHRECFITESYRKQKLLTQLFRPKPAVNKAIIDQLNKSNRPLFLLLADCDMKKALIYCWKHLLT